MSVPPTDRSQALARDLDRIRAEIPSSAGAELRASEVARARAGGDGGELARALLRHAAYLNRAGDVAGAGAAVAEAAAIARAEGDDVVLLEAVAEASRAAGKRGDSTRAMELAHEGLAHARRAGARWMEGMFLALAGFVHAQQDEPEPYLGYTREALAIFRALGDDKLTAHALANCGGALSRMKRHAEAHACYDEALPIAVRLGWERGEALVRAGIGGVLCEQGRLDEGAVRYAESEAVLARLGDAFQMARNRMILGRYHLEAGAHARAIAILESAGALAAEHGFDGTASEVHGLLSRAHEDAGQAAEALASLREHVRLREKLSEERAAEALRVLRAEHQIEGARRDAERERERSAELTEINDALRAALARQQALQADLERLASTDSLTGLPNRRALLEVLHREIRRSRRTGRPLALALADVDRFKSINDVHGHAVGDDVLVEIARRVRLALRAEDTVARWGGEELCLVLVETGEAGARRAAERIRAAVGEVPFETRVGAVAVTISVGLAVAPGPSDPDALLARADAALYRAKAEGRDRVVEG